MQRGFAAQYGAYPEEYANACSHGGMYSVDRSRVKIDFSSSLNPLGPPAAALNEMIRNASELSSNYPDPECAELKKSLCQYLGNGISEGQLCIGNGAMEIIHWFAGEFGKKVAVVPSPTFCEYELASKKAGAQVKLVRLDEQQGFELDPDAIISSATHADTLFLCNPNNPTGLLSTKAVEKILDNISSSTMVLLDECFIELSDRPADSMVGRTAEFKNLVVLRSLTKSFALAGLRVGYSVSSEQTAKKLARNKIHWNVNGIAQAAGVAALRAADKYLKSARATIFNERRFIGKKIRKLDLNGFSATPLQSNANYYLVMLEGMHAPDSASFRDLLLEKTGVLVRDCSTFAGMGTQYIRVAVKKRRQNAELSSAFETVAGVARP